MKKIFCGQTLFKKVLGIYLLQSQYFRLVVFVDAVINISGLSKLEQIY